MFSETNIWIHSLSHDVLFRYGKNAAGNFAIIDMSNPEDLWFHVSGESSAHVIACLHESDTHVGKKLDKKQTSQIIKQGALLCKNISKYKDKKNLEIVYCKIKDLEKTDTIGTVNIKNQKTIYI
jgi:predicted ribosome quality control (RQC) complex YloA/Tae2 family protein